jgi:L,D-peptidoglycan transpeptidase YkuD (ErfK/YbiS/YcfS/YnhG family)
MALINKRRIAAPCGVVLALLLGVGTYELWLRMALRDHPWWLESFVDALAADCRTSPGVIVFSEELSALNAQVNDAKTCLIHADGVWAIRRNYTPCVQKLLGASLAALRIRMNEAARFREEKVRLEVALKALEFELGVDAQAQRSGARPEIKNYNQSRARTLFETARNLAAAGQTESALTASMGAQAAWAQSENFVAAELARFYDTRLRAQWEKEAQDLLRWTRQTGRAAILVDKLAHRCLLLTGGRVEKSYVANLGRNWYRIKVQEQDASTPEGEYRIKQMFRSTSFGAALLLDYPNAADWQRFSSMKKTGDITARAQIGGSIEIHGSGRLNSDWTDGCVSLENPDMNSLFRLAYVGMPVTIVGTCTIGGGNE